MEREQIIKALKCCTRGRKQDDIPCFDCSYNECNVVGGTSERQITGTCQGWLMKDALALINSQEQRIGAQDMTISELRKRVEKAEHDADRYAQRIKELTEDVERVSKQCGEIIVECDERDAERLKQVAELTEENERLKAICDMKECVIENAEAVIARTRADTVRKMHSEIKERCIKGGIYPAFVASTIDQIAKEMVEDTK